MPVPTLDGVYVTLQLAESAVGLARVHGDVRMEPEPLLVNLTSPDGGVGVKELSVTVAVQVDGTPIPTDAGEHTTAVLVGLRSAMVWLV